MYQSSVYEILSKSIFYRVNYLKKTIQMVKNELQSEKCIFFYLQL